MSSRLRPGPGAAATKLRLRAPCVNGAVGRVRYSARMSNATAERTFEWFESVFTSKAKRGLPKWARLSALASDGTVWLPAAVVGSEMEVLLCASYDGQPLVALKNHTYVESEWAKREFKKHAAVVARIEERTRAAAQRRS